MKTADITAGTTYVYTTGRAMHVLSTEKYEQGKRHAEGTNTVKRASQHPSPRFRTGVLALTLARWSQDPAKADAFFKKVAAGFDIDGFLTADPDTGKFTQPGEFVAVWGGHTYVVQAVVVLPRFLERSYADEQALRAQRGEEHKRQNLAKAATDAARLAQATAEFEELTALVGADAAEALGYWKRGEFRAVPITTITALVEAGIRRATGGDPQ